MSDSVLGSILGGIGTVLDAPRSVLYSLGNSAYKSLTGDTGPDIQHFSDILTRAGMDKDSVLTQGLGFLGDMATDPLTYVGGALANRALKRLGEGSGALGRALGAGGESLAGANPFKAARSGISKFTGIGRLAPEAATELTPELLVTQGRNANAGGDILGGYFRSGIPAGAEDAAGELTTRFRGLANNMDEMQRLTGMGLQGAYSPTANSIGITAEAALDPQNAIRMQRHELVHGMIDQAAKAPTGEAASRLPFMMRVPAQLKRAGGNDVGTLLGGFGNVGDELAAQALENRTIGGKMSSAAKFLFNPDYNAAYAKQLATSGTNPTALGLYSTLPMAPKILAAGAPQTASSILQQLGD